MKQNKRIIEDIYPLSPMQQGKLSLYEAGSRVPGVTQALRRVGPLLHAVARVPSRGCPLTAWALIAQASRRRACSRACPAT